MWNNDLSSISSRHTGFFAHFLTLKMYENIEEIRHARMASLFGNFLVAIAKRVFYGTFHKRFILNSLKSI